LFIAKQHSDNVQCCGPIDFFGYCYAWAVEFKFKHLTSIFGHVFCSWPDTYGAETTLSIEHTSYRRWFVDKSVSGTPRKPANT
jgi:hypothetical protein